MMAHVPSLHFLAAFCSRQAITIKRRFESLVGSNHLGVIAAKAESAFKSQR
jgi:hypothetical protein